MADEGLIDGKMVVDAVTGCTEKCDCMGCLSDDYVGKFEQTTAPTIVQIPDGKWGWWWDTVNTQMIQVRNRGATMYGVECTAL